MSKFFRPAFAACAFALLLVLPPATAHAQSARSPVRSGISAGLGVAVSFDGSTFRYFQATVPIKVSDAWAVGSSFVNFSELGEADAFHEEEGDLQFGGDDRFAAGLEVRRAVGGLPFTAYLGARGMYSISKYESNGLYGGVLAGGQYALDEHFAVGAEAQVLRSPDRFLFVPLGLVSFRF